MSGNRTTPARNEAEITDSARPANLKSGETGADASVEGVEGYASHDGRQGGCGDEDRRGDGCG